MSGIKLINTKCRHIHLVKSFDMALLCQIKDKVVKA